MGNLYHVSSSPIKCTLRKNSTSEHLFWRFRLSQIEDCIQCLEGPNSTWKDHDRNLGVHRDPKIPIMVLPGTQYSWTPRSLSWFFQVLFGPSRYSIQSSICDNLKHQKRCLEIIFVYRATDSQIRVTMTLKQE